jgi:hypothetical protein
MTRHEPPRTIRSILATTADRHVDERENSGLVIDETVSEVIAALAEGDLDEKPPSQADLERAWVSGQVRRLRRSHTESIRALISAQGDVMMPFDLGEEYDMAFTVCGPRALNEMYGIEVTQGRIVTLGSLVSSDVRLMSLEQVIDLRVKRLAVERDRPLHDALAAQIARYPNYRAYRNAL